MKALGMSVLALMASAFCATLSFGGPPCCAAQSAGEPPCCATCVPSCAPSCAPTCCPVVVESCPKQTITFRIETTEDKTCSQRLIVHPYTAKEKTAVQAVPSCEKVPVCTVDPCTGCKKTEWVDKPTTKLVRTTILELTPPSCDKECKVETKPRTCTKVYIERTPCCPH